MGHNRTGKCVEIAWAKPDQGTVVELNTCNGADNEKWKLNPSTQQIETYMNNGNCLTSTVRVPENGFFYYAPISEGNVAVILLNREGPAAKITSTFSQIGVHTGKAIVRDLWAHTTSSDAMSTFTAVVPEHGAVFLKLMPQK
eukprot:NODE_707_length_732_cov_112.912152_g641_i0.p1 GENE.NODE_707_length_732_cov_112.912152_g641_i0~~NODE_707_length_732_cov_112.912152_g641_i0.p1  ORF type:complete len:152 (-),score=27.50 NODE_707_length_732_cov_112.912152_g641_i0:277-702(-)